jgi:hypothetical protein
MFTPESKKYCLKSATIWACLPHFERTPFAVTQNRLFDTITKTAKYIDFLEQYPIFQTSFAQHYIASYLDSPEF